MRRAIVLFFAVACCCVVLAARADDLFTINASGGGTNVTASSNNVIDLVGNLIKTENEFASLSNRNSSSSLRYAGVDNAVLVSRNASGTAATITIPSTGFTKTFN